MCTFFKFESEAEAVKAANNTSMGLASYCFTKNIDRMWRLFENLEAGMIGLNTGEFCFEHRMWTSLMDTQVTLRPPKRRLVVLSSPATEKNLVKMSPSLNT